jgi:hypothetical protein
MEGHDPRQLNLFAIRRTGPGDQSQAAAPTLAELQHMLHVSQIIQLNTGRSTEDRAP